MEADPEQLLDGLNDEQRSAATIPAGPLVIAAGAGTGKTRVLSRRTAYAAAVGAMNPAQALLVTFTDKAAGEMAERLRALHVPGATAMTFHKAAWRQLRYFVGQAGGPALGVCNQPWRLVAPQVRGLPGNYKFTPTQDVLDAIAWIKNARLPLDGLDAAAERAHRSLPIPSDLLARIARNYERLKDQQSLVDFDDMILRMADLMRDRPDVAEQVRARYSWFSVDEFQDTNPAQFDLLQLWLGDRTDLCVVGDEQQTIYSFAGATSQFLTRFPEYFHGARTVSLTTNYRSSPQILDFANRLLPPRAALRPTRADGPVPDVRDCPDADAELDLIADTLRGWHSDGVEWGQQAVLVRLNADIPPIEGALTAAGIPYVVRGTAFFARRDIRDAVRKLAQLPGNDLALECYAMLADSFGYDPDEVPVTAEARERHAALGALLQLVRQAAAAAGAAGNSDVTTAVLADLAARRDAEQNSQGRGVTLATLHRAKGLEWDAVMLPGLEQGRLPVQQAFKSPQLLAEERRLLYVGITRARRHLVLSWSRDRPGGRSAKRTRSEFLDLVAPRAPKQRGRTAAGSSLGVTTVDPVAAARAIPAAGEDPLYERLKEWRLHVAKRDEVPAYIVFSNSTLAAIARAAPTDEPGLAKIPGVGPVKIERYGTDVLAVLATDPQEPATES